MLYKIVKGNSIPMHIIVRKTLLGQNRQGLVDVDLSQATNIVVALLGGFCAVSLPCSVDEAKGNELVCTIPPYLDFGCYDIQVAWQEEGMSMVAVERNFLAIVGSNAQTRIPLGVLDGENSGMCDLRFYVSNSADEDDGSGSAATKIDITDGKAALDMGLVSGAAVADNIQAWLAVKGGYYLVVNNNMRYAQHKNDVIIGTLQVFKDDMRHVVTQILTSNTDAATFNNNDVGSGWGHVDDKAFIIKRTWHNTGSPGSVVNGWTEWDDLIKHPQTEAIPTEYVEGLFPE